MKVARPRDGEAATLDALFRLAVLDSAPDPEFDALATVAATICGVPIALVSLIDTDRQWFKANIGLRAVSETPRDHSFCAHAVLGEEIFEVEDARRDERFADNPLVTGGPAIRFYAGAPVNVEGGQRVGTVCVIDREPRRLTPIQRETLRHLAIAVGKALEGRAAAKALQHQAQATFDRERMLRLVLDSVPSTVAYWDSDLRCRFANGAHRDWFGVDPESLVGTHLGDFGSAERFARMLPFVERALDGEKFAAEATIDCFGGATREGLLFYTPDVVDGRVAGFLVQVTDVTSLKATQQALVHEKAAFQRALEAHDRTSRALNDAQQLGGIGSWDFDFASGRTVWSDEMYRIAGRDRNLPPPIPEQRFEILLPESQERLRAASALCQKNGVPYVLELGFVRRSDGENRWIEARGGALRGRDGHIVGLQGTVQDITERKRLTAELARQHELANQALQQLRHVTDRLPALISYLDGEERFRFANERYAEWLGRDPLDLVGKSLAELYGPATYDGFKASIRQALRGETVRYARELTTLQGRRYVDVTVVPEKDGQGRVKGLFVMMIDATARRDAETALRRSEERLRMMADNIPALVTYIDHDQRYQFVNEYLGSVFHTEPRRLIGRTMREVTGEARYAEIAPHVAAALRGEQVTFEGVWQVRGRHYHHHSTYVPDVDPAGAICGFYAMSFDITTMKETQRQLDALARVDVLTALPNRRQFDERLAEAMARTRRTGMPLALMFLDLDHFKRINDTWGHGVGDLVLQEFASRLKRQVRSTDMVARLAGDEFVVLLEGVRKAVEVEAVAEKIVRAIRPPMTLGSGDLVALTASIGLTFYEGDDQPADLLLAAADRALYQAKDAGRDRFALATFGTSTLLGLLGDEPAIKRIADVDAGGMTGSRCLM